MSETGKRTASNVNEAIPRFITRALAAGCMRMELRDKDRSLVSPPWELPYAGGTEALADAIVEAAQDDAAGEPGAKKYFAFGVRADGQDTGRVPVLVVSHVEGATVAHEDVTMGGITAELIRDRRELQKMTNSYTEQLFQRLSRQNQILGEMVEKFQGQHLRLIEAHEAAESHKEERAIRRAELQNTVYATRRTVEAIVPLIPAGLNRMLGKAMGTEDPLGIEVVESALQGLTEEEFIRMVQTLPEAKQAQFLMIAEMIMKRVEAKKRAEAERVAREKEEEEARARAAATSPGGIG
jgi:hypothetical protein